MPRTVLAPNSFGRMVNMDKTRYVSYWTGTLVSAKNCADTHEDMRRIQECIDTMVEIGARRFEELYAHQQEHAEDLAKGVPSSIA